MKNITSKAIFVLVFITVFCLDRWLLRPMVQAKYLHQDLWELDNGSWHYSIITFLIIVVGFGIYKLWHSNFNILGLLLFMMYITIPSALLAYCLSPLTENTTLYLNSLYDETRLEKVYVMQRHDTNKVLQLTDKAEEIIVFKSDLHKIDALRKKKNLKSLYELKNKDTIHVHFTLGFLEVKYLE